MESESKVTLPKPIDLSGSEYFEYQVKRDIQEIFETVPGLYFECLIHLPEKEYALIQYWGWAPSLHRCHYSIKIDLQGKADKLSRIKQIFSKAVEIAEKQKSRASYAKRYELATPLPVIEGQKIEKRHLSVDRSLPALVQMTDVSYISELDEMMRDLLSKTQDEDNDYIFNGNGHIILCGLGVFVGLDVWYDFPGGRGKYIVDNGINLRIRADIPDMAVSAIAGKKLKNLCEIHPDYDNRIIKRISKENNTLQISLVPETLPLSDFFDL